MPRSRSSQRERLIEAMIVVAARYGYGEASVARVIGEAGVSRATFYQHFADRGACFLAAYREVARRVAASLRGGKRRGTGTGALRELLERLLEAADREPASARVVLLESLAAGRAVRSEHERLLDAFEEAIEAHLDDAGEQGVQLEVPARAVLGGLGGVVASRVIRGETGRLTELLDDLETWVRSYARPSGRRRRQGEWDELGSSFAEPIAAAPSPLDRRLPRGRAALSPALVASEQRQRVLAAVARLAREKGYAEMTVSEIVATAGISREVFYEQFRGKEDAFMAAQAFGLEESVSVTAGRFFSEETWPKRTLTGLEAALTYVAEQQDLVFVDLVESYAAGMAAIRRSLDNRMAFTLFLEDGYRQRPEAESLPRLCSEAISGAINELMRKRVVAGRTSTMRDLLPQVSYLTLAPFVGPRRALELVESRLATARPRIPSERSREAPVEA